MLLIFRHHHPCGHVGVERIVEHQGLYVPPSLFPALHSRLCHLFLHVGLQVTSVFIVHVGGTRCFLHMLVALVVSCTCWRYSLCTFPIPTTGWTCRLGSLWGVACILYFYLVIKGVKQGRVGFKTHACFDLYSVCFSGNWPQCDIVNVCRRWRIPMIFTLRNPVLKVREVLYMLVVLVVYLPVPTTLWTYRLGSLGVLNVSEQCFSIFFLVWLQQHDQY